jgi:sulfite exporter TauE/SafE
VRGIAARFGSRDFRGTFLLGITLGFLPCGFLYGALAAATATGSAPSGALAMGAFGLGTIPSLAVAGIAGQAAAKRWRALTARVSPPILAFNALVLTVLAFERIPLPS